MSDHVVHTARGCVLQHSVRTLDAIHLAAVQACYGEGLAIPLVTADVRQAAAGRAMGFQVLEVAP